MKFYSKIGGFYSDDPYGEGKMRGKNVTLRTNNPGAINRASWQKDLPGYLGNYITSYSTVNGTRVPNYTTFYASPEEGVIAYWWLLKRYRDNYNIRMTPRGIITMYGGGQNYSSYLRYITNLGFGADQIIDLYDDQVLLPFAKAMFRYEAGVPIPWTDAQILYGFNAARGIEKAQKATGKPLGEVWKDLGTPPTDTPTKSLLERIFGAIFGTTNNPDQSKLPNSHKSLGNLDSKETARNGTATQTRQAPVDKRLFSSFRDFVTSVLGPLGAILGTTGAYIFGGMAGLIGLAFLGILCYIVYKRYWK